MERRNFLAGIFGGLAAAGSGIIVKASPQDIARFATKAAPDEPMVIDRPNNAEVTRQNGLWLLYDSHGTPVVALREVRPIMERFSMDVTSTLDTNDFVIGALHRQPRVEMVGEILSPMALWKVLQGDSK